MSNKPSHKSFIRHIVCNVHWDIDDDAQWHLIDDGDTLIQEWRSNGPSPKRTHRRGYYWRCRSGLVRHSMQQVSCIDKAMTELEDLKVHRSSAHFKTARLTNSWDVDVADWDGRRSPKANCWKDTKVRHQWQWHQKGPRQVV